MSKIKTSPNRALTTCGSIRNVISSLSTPPKPGSLLNPGSRNEASPNANTSVTATAADHSHHSRLSIRRKCAEGLSGGLLLLTGMPSVFVRLIDDHQFARASSAIRLRTYRPWAPLSARRNFLALSLDWKSMRSVVFASSNATTETGLTSNTHRRSPSANCPRAISCIKEVGSLNFGDSQPTPIHLLKVLSAKPGNRFCEKMLPAAMTFRNGTSGRQGGEAAWIHSVAQFPQMQRNACL